MGLKNKPDITAVRAYWNRLPGGGCVLEVGNKYEVGSPEFFEYYDQIKQTDNELFVRGLFRFDQYKGKRIMDIGCGYGWFVKEFAKNGGVVTGIDLSPAAVELTKKMLTYYKLTAEIREANAEELPFADNTFDLVFSNGVLHHTPETQKAVDEAWRVLKPGGRAVISLYYRNLLLRPFMFKVTQTVMRLFGMKVVGRENMANSSSVEEFVRQYDGTDNPIGKVYSQKEAAQLFRKFRITGTELHYFPKRFLPEVIRRHIPLWLHKLLDNKLGTMIYFNLTK